ncbi:MAG: hypothetical protein L0287_12800, partial [Anaerolineae bacterium]|nr:hypothetical protein [Anaerolineae bacterium]
MFAHPSRMELAIRVLLIAVIVFNALIPSAALAQASNHEAVEPLASPGMKGSASKSFSILSSRSALQVATPTPTPADTEAPTPELSATPTATLEITPTATVAPSHTQSETIIATLESTPSPAITFSPIGTQTSVVSQPP